MHTQTYLPSNQLPKSPTPKLTVLIVEDDEVQVRLLSLFLQQRGYATLVARDGQSALQQLAQNVVNIMLLDIRMPGMNGFEACVEVRKRSSLPILILTALSQVEQMIYCLEIGADGYITKPFSLYELEARLQALTRRLPKLWQNSSLSSTAQDDFILDKYSLHVTIGNRKIALTPLEYRLLDYLLQKTGRAIKKSELMRYVYECEFVIKSRMFDVLICRLRAKIEPDPTNPIYLKTVSKIGYKFMTHSNSSSPE